MAGNPFLDLISGGINSLLGFLGSGQTQQTPQIQQATTSPAHMALMNNYQQGPVPQEMNDLVQWAQQSKVAGPVNWDYRGRKIYGDPIPGLGSERQLLGEAVGGYNPQTKELLFTPENGKVSQEMTTHELLHAADLSDKAGKLQQQYEQMAQMQKEGNPYLSNVALPASYEEGNMPGRIDPTSGENLMSQMSEWSARNRAKDVIQAAPSPGSGVWSEGINRNTDATYLTPRQDLEVDAYYSTNPDVISKSSNPRENARFWAMSMIDKGAPKELIYKIYQSMLSGNGKTK